MKVQCTLGKKEVGHWMGGTRYVFKPQADGALVADIENEDHVDSFLKIDGFKLYRGEKAAPAAPKAPASKDVPPALFGSSVHPTSFEINGNTLSLGDVVRSAHAASGLSIEDWNALSEDDRHNRIDAELDRLAGGQSDEEDIAALNEAYKAKFGRAPHHTWSADTIKAKLAEAA